ncbi:YCF48-related protein [Pelagibius sp. Alg239-R121]|uniref:WD40/YVTN/BNR-like repeat-containing protein n=1 Tax=Pelagibius sp. Alg239-R121 TaxID=2993448 RepID=UPI0024A661F5|nr:YCF48-related protein [Pelagibius sp. Alg239-R121]
MIFRHSLAIAGFLTLGISAAWSNEGPSPAFDGARTEGAYWGIASDGNSALAVGPGGAHARKSGQDAWTPTKLPGKPLLLAIARLNARTFVAVGGTGFTSGKGVILRSVDGGKTFQPTANQAAPLYEVKFLSAETGFAVGVDGLLVKSTDAGQSWQRIETGGKTKLWALHFFSGNEGLIGGGETPWQNDQRSSGSILRTEDGGKSWQSVYEGSKRISDFSFLSSKTGYAAGVGGQLLKTTDGGRSWSEAGQTPLKAIVNALAFVSESCGLIVGAGGTAYITNDGGKSWDHAIQVTEGSFLEDLSIDPNDSDAFWVAGGDGSLGQLHLGKACDS